MIVKYKTSSSDKPIEYGFDKETIDSYVEETGLAEISLGTCASVYADYVEYCESYDYLPCSQNTLSAHLRKEYGVCTIVRKVDGKSCRIYVKKV